MAGIRYSARRRKGRSGLVWGVFAILFIVVMFKWGLPLFINVLAGPSGTKAGDVDSSEDVVPPQIPSLSSLVDATNSAMLRVDGFTEDDVEVEGILNGEKVTGTNSDDKGGFKLEFRLIDGANMIQVRARDKAGNTSESATKTITFDKKVVDVTIDSPKDGTEVFGQNSQNITFLGQVNKPDASVSINGNYARLDASGNFDQAVRLVQGDNSISVKATDKAGNTIEKVVRIRLTL